MSEGKAYRCVISGEEFENPGSAMQYGRRAYGDDWKEYDGVLTDIGPVSGLCVPVYQKALDELVFDPMVGNLRKAVAKRVRDVAFVERTLFEVARDDVFGILDSADPANFHLAVRQLKSIFLKRIDLHKVDVNRCFGKGLSLNKALACMNESTRTMAFINAVLAAVSELDESYPYGYEVVDAGCGPIPLFGLVAALKSEKAIVTCLEYNPESVEVARRIVKNMGLSDRVKIVDVDAVEYRHEKPIDLLVSETMYSGLLNGEEMVQILDNLTSQTSDGAKVIPGLITVNAGISNPSIGGERISIDRDMVVPFERKYEYGPGKRKGAPVRFEIPLDGLETGRDYQLALSSDVFVDDKNILSGHDSSIVSPIRVAGTRFFIDGDPVKKVLRVLYMPGSDDNYVMSNVVEKDNS